MPDEAPDRPYAGRLVDGEHRFGVRVYYEDTDAGGVVYHANYLRYFERARSDLLALVGADHVAALKEGGGGYVVAEVTLRYKRPAALGDALVIVTTLEEARSSSCIVQQRVMRDGQVVAEGRLVLVFVGPDGRPKRQPAAWLEAFAAVAQEGPGAA